MGVCRTVALLAADSDLWGRCQRGRWRYEVARV